MFEPRPYERDSRYAESKISQIIDEISNKLPMEIILSSLLSNVLVYVKQLVDEDQWEVLNLSMHEFCNELEDSAWVTKTPVHYLEVMHRYDRRHV